jgi:hypothetical protein
MVWFDLAHSFPRLQSFSPGSHDRFLENSKVTNNNNVVETDSTVITLEVFLCYVVTRLAADERTNEWKIHIENELEQNDGIDAMRRNA